MSKEDVDELRAKRMCYACVGDQYLSDIVRSKGKHRKCSYCGQTRRGYAVAEIAQHVAGVFEQHYERTSDQPDDSEYALLSDGELDYDWSRHGEPVAYAIMNCADIPEQAANDIQAILEEDNSDFDSAAIGEETEFAHDSYYEETSINTSSWREAWRAFENSLKTEARFFSRTAAAHLTSIFAGVEQLQTTDGAPLLVNAGPGTGFHAFHRARVFQSDDKLTVALERPDLHIGPPPGLFAAAGRMNARGISVFYGANTGPAAIAEVRPPVGCQVVVARFEIIRPLQLLDLTAVSRVRVRGSLFDPEFAEQLGRAKFLGSLSGRITQPVMPDDEPFEYLATQAIANFLATEAAISIDGIIFPSVQVAGGALNVVLFHKAARVQAMEIPEGTEIRARTGQNGPDGWEEEYAVVEETPPAPINANEDEADALPTLAALASLNASWVDLISDAREPALRVMADSVSVHRVRSVQFATDAFTVTRHRWEKRSIAF